MKNGRRTASRRRLPEPRVVTTAVSARTRSTAALVEDHLEACLAAGCRSPASTPRSCPTVGVPGRPLALLDVADSSGRALAAVRIGEDYASPQPSTPSPQGRWKAPAPTHFSTKEMREDGATSTSRRLQALGEKAALHIANYGIARGPADGATRPSARPVQLRRVRSRASIRIPWQVAVDARATSRTVAERQIDPYVVARLMVETICGAMSDASGRCPER